MESGRGLVGRALASGIRGTGFNSDCGRIQYAVACRLGSKFTLSCGSGANHLRYDTALANNTHIKQPIDASDYKDFENFLRKYDFKSNDSLRINEMENLV